MAAVESIAAKIIEILARHDYALKLEATIDGAKIEFENGPNEIIDDCWEEFYALGNSILPMLLKREISISELPAILTVWGIDSFGVLLGDVGEYKFLNAACMDLDPSNFSWDPFNSALRSYFSLDKIANIETKFEFDLAVSSFTDSVETYSTASYLPIDDDIAFALMAQMNALKSSIFASYEKINNLDSAISKIRPYENGNIFAQTPLHYEGSSFGLEAEIAEWIQKQISTELFADDDFLFDENDQEVNENLESLKNAWLQKPEVELSEIQDHVWKIVAANLPGEFSHVGRELEFVVHCLYQLHERVIDEDGGSFERSDYPIERYRVVLLRTGERREYNADLDKCFLALQILVGADSLGTDAANIESEIEWLRLKEKDNPLLGVSKEELEILESTYLASLEKKRGD